jgi:hypothetical protein
MAMPSLVFLTKAISSFVAFISRAADSRRAEMSRYQPVSR